MSYAYWPSFQLSALKILTMPHPMPAFSYKHRLHLLEVLSSTIRPTVVCEVGVQKGLYAEAVLQTVPSVQTFYLVDLWAHQSNYQDFANLSKDEHELYYNETLTRLSRWQHKLKVLRGHSTAMSKHIPDGSVDWIYIDARHDYKGCMEDLRAYYPKLKNGGLMSGHDYMSAEEVKLITPDQDWSICYDGTVEPRAVKGAVDDFLKLNGLNLILSSEETAWPTWSFFKP